MPPPEPTAQRKGRTCSFLKVTIIAVFCPTPSFDDLKQQRSGAGAGVFGDVVSSQPASHVRAAWEHESMGGSSV